MSKRVKRNLWLLGGIFLSIVVSVSVSRDFTQPYYNVLPNMAYAVAAESYYPNPVFPDGKVLQAPPEHTVARGTLPIFYTPTPEDALRAGEELKNPWSADDQEVRLKGGRLFGIYCTPCHGAGGAGDGNVAKRGYPPPPSLFAERAMNMRDGQMFHILTYGQNNMPPYNVQLTPEERWMVIAYVRSLQAQEAQKHSPASPQEPTAPQATDAPSAGAPTAAEDTQQTTAPSTSGVTAQ
jgi:mono/diheme cytochrome c family protein